MSPTSSYPPSAFTSNFVIRCPLPRVKTRKGKCTVDGMRISLFRAFTINSDVLLVVRGCGHHLERYAVVQNAWAVRVWYRDRRKRYASTRVLKRKVGATAIGSKTDISLIYLKCLSRCRKVCSINCLDKSEISWFNFLRCNPTGHGTVRM